MKVMTMKQWIMLIPAVGGIALAILSIYGYESRNLIACLSLLSAIVPIMVWWDDHKESRKQQEVLITLKDKVEELGMEVVENPEWIYCIIDAKKHFLFGIRRQDGSVDWGAGIPRPVKKEMDILKGRVETLEAIQNSHKD